MTMLKASPEVPPQLVAEEPNALGTYFLNYFRRLRGG